MSDPSPTPQGAPEGTTSAAGAASKGWFESFVARLSRAIGRHPVWIVVAAALLAVVGGYVYAQHLKLVNDRSQMTDPSLPFNKNYRQYVESFGDDNKFLILVVRSKGDAPPDKPRREAMKIFAKRWSEVLREEPALFPRVVERLDLDAMGPGGLLYLPFEKYGEVIKAAEAQVPRVQDWAADPGLINLMQELRAGIEGIEPGKEGQDREKAGQLLDGAGQLFDWMAAGLASDSPPRPDFDLQAQVKAQIAEGGVDPDGFFFRDEGRVLLVFATIEGDSSRRNRFEVSMGHARDALKKARELVTDGAGVEGGMAGWPAMEYEEMETIQRDFARGTLITLVLVSLLFMWGFRSLVRPALAALCLGIAIGATFLFAYLVVGYLNMLAMIFAVILVALGIDFAIHFVTHYERALGHKQDAVAAVHETFARVGGAIWVGGLTTVVAFLTMSFTEFVGLQELGVIAGGGLALCLMCITIVYPAMLVLLDTRAPKLAEALQVGRARAATMRPPALSFEGRRPLAAALLGAATLIAAAGFATGQYHFNTNLINLLPVDGETLTWQEALLAADDRAAFAISTTQSLETLQARQAALEALPEVRSTESLLPLKLKARRAAAAPLCGQLAEVSVGQAEAPGASPMRRELYGLRSTLRTYREANAQAADALEPLQTKVEAVFKAIGALEPEVAERRLAALQAQLRGFSVAQLDDLRGLSSHHRCRSRKQNASDRKFFVVKSGEAPASGYLDAAARDSPRRTSPRGSCVRCAHESRSQEPIRRTPMENQIQQYLTQLSENPSDIQAITALEDHYEASQGWDDLVRSLVDLSEDATAPEISARLLVRAAEVAGLRQGDLDGAQDILSHASAIGADEAEVDVRLATLALKGDWRSVIELRQQVLTSTESQDEKVYTLCQMGFVFRDRLDDRRNAMKAFQAAFRLDRVCVVALRAARDIYLDVGDWKLVAQLLQFELQALQGQDASHEEMADSFVMLGDVLREHLDNPDTARSCYDNALKLDASHDGATRGLILICGHC